MNDEVFQRVKEERLLLKILKNRHHSWIGHTVRHNEFVVNIPEGAISEKKGRGNTLTTILKISRQKHGSLQLHSQEKNGLQQFQMESCQPFKSMKDKNLKSASAIAVCCTHLYSCGWSHKIIVFLFCVFSRNIRARWMRVIEAVIVAAVSATLGFLMIYFLNDCKPLGQDPTSNPIQVRRIFVVWSVCE